MRTYNEIKKVMNINESFNARLNYRIMHGWGNCGGITPCVTVFPFEDGYKMFLFNMNEYNSVYSPHGEYTYIVTKEGIEYYSDTDPVPFSYKFDPILCTPWGWETEEFEYLNDLLRILQEGLQNK